VNECKSALEAEMGQALGALHSLRAKTKLSAEKWKETQLLSKSETEKWFEDYGERETALARNRVQNKETAILQELKDMTTAENERVITGNPETKFREILECYKA